VFVGLGCPKQERLIAAVGPCLPTSWYLGCGAAIPLAAGHGAAGAAVDAAGWLEWLFRLLSEPRRCSTATWSRICPSPCVCWPQAPPGAS
jgi:N-acetylglucosaminyldiphosphoundecaprenol N-acetyl-beta-D-mannosaminyltransferase